MKLQVDYLEKFFHITELAHVCVDNAAWGAWVVEGWLVGQ